MSPTLTPSIPASTAPLAREAPAPDPILGVTADDAHEDRLNEPTLAVDQIQGNILAGFSKDHQMMVFLKITDATMFRAWLRPQVKFVSTVSEVLAFNRLFKEVRSRRGRETNAVKSTWFNIAFSFGGLQKLKDAGASIDLGFTDTSFTQGLLNRSGSLGDPLDPAQEGHPSNWVVGGTPETDADVVLIVASDDLADLYAEVSRLELGLYSALVVHGVSVHSGARIIYKQQGANLPAPVAGHEHFGFLDGVSQPGVRGLVSGNANDVLMLRQNPNKRDNKGKDSAGNGIGDVAQGKPGQDLLWPGQFVFGYVGQDPLGDDIDAATKDPISAGPDWAKNGSYLVFRRLRQDVAGFHTFLRETAAAQGLPSPPHSSAARLLGSKLVGRWPSGAPVMRAPTDDDPTIAANDCLNNDFEFQAGTEAIPGAHFPITTPFDCAGNPASVADQDTTGKVGKLCPFSSHIRKVYPRDDTPITPAAGSNDPCGARARLKETDTQTHRILRRGIPFGTVSASTPDHPKPDLVDRGLLFLCYQTSIADQFEFIQSCWSNNPEFKEVGTGFDPIIGQNNTSSDRARSFVTSDAAGNPITLTTTADWVIPTGGGYFFSPSIDAMETRLAEPGPTSGHGSPSPSPSGP